MHNLAGSCCHADSRRSSALQVPREFECPHWKLAAEPHCARTTDTAGETTAVSLARDQVRVLCAVACFCMTTGVAVSSHKKEVTPNTGAELRSGVTDHHQGPCSAVKSDEAAAAAVRV